MPAAPTVDNDLDTGIESDTAKPWKVILHNDDVNLVEHVTRTLRRPPFSMSADKAAQVTLDVHTLGKATVADVDSTDAAQPSLIALAAAQLWATIEKG